MKYKLIIKVIEEDDFYEFRIGSMKELTEILEYFNGKTIEVDLYKIEKTRKLSRWLDDK